MADQPDVKLSERMRGDWLPGGGDVQPVTLSAEQLAEQTAWISGPPAMGLGQMVVDSQDVNLPSRLNVSSYHVHVTLNPPIALVQIDQSFYNPESRRQVEGTFVFNLPPAASVSRFAMYVTRASLIEGELIERKQAADIYQSIVNRQRDPAILEQIGDHLFKMRIFPIAPLDNKRILLDYTLPLESRDGQYVFRLPLAGDPLPIWDFHINGSVLGATVEGSLHVESPGGPIEVRQAGGTATFELAREQFHPERDLLVTFRQDHARQGTVRSYALGNAKRFGEKPQRYFSTILPPREGAPDRDDSPLDLLILADSSGNPQDHEQLAAALRNALAALRPDDRFRLGCADLTARWLGAWQAGEPANTAPALAAWRRELFLGQTDLGRSLSALEFPEGAARRRCVLYLGSGENETNPALAKEEAAELAKRLAAAGARLMVVNTAGPNQAGKPGKLLAQALRANGGLSFSAADPTSRQQFFSWLVAGMPLPDRVEKVSVKGVAAEDLFYPSAWPAGQALPVLGYGQIDDVVELNVVTRRSVAAHGGDQQANAQQAGERNEYDFALKVAPAAAHDLFIGRNWCSARSNRCWKIYRRGRPTATGCAGRSRVYRRSGAC